MLRTSKLSTKTGSHHRIFSESNPLHNNPLKHFFFLLSPLFLVAVFLVFNVAPSFADTLESTSATGPTSLSSPTPPTTPETSSSPSPTIEVVSTSILSSVISQVQNITTNPAIITNISEKNINNGKIVTISAPNEDPEHPLTNINAHTRIPEIYKVGEEDKIKINWQNNNDQNVLFKASDTNNNGKLDYVEWVVPHLSEQTFKIIFISKAFELNQDKEPIQDIYDSVRTKDGNWVSVSNGHYVRATFQQALDNTKDNTIYAKPTNQTQSATIEVYPVYTDENGDTKEGPLAGTFKKIDHEGTYKILLTNLQTPTDIFDLKIIGDTDIDYIVDPAGMLVKYGSFAKPNATTGNQSVTEVGFQPKVVMFFGNGLTADGNTTGVQEYFGAATSSTKRAVIATAIGDGVTNNGSKRFSNALIISQITANGASPVVSAEADFVSLDADGFTINWTTCDATQRIVNYIALGGTDLTNANVGSFTAPTSAIDKAVTGLGFQPDALILFDNAVTTTPTAVGNSNNPAFNMGFVVGTSKQNSRVATRGTATNGSWAYQRTNSAINTVDKVGGLVRTATIKTMDADGFTMNFSVAPANAVYLNYIALKGGQYDTGSFNQATTTGNQSVTTGFQPAGVLFQSANLATATVTSAPGRASFGVGISSTERGSIWSGVSAAAPPAADTDLDRTNALKTWTEGTPTLTTAMDFVSNNATSFTVNNTTTDATSREILYFAFGSNPVVEDTTPPAPSSFSPTSAGTIADATQTITFTTDENATCKVSLTDQAYADMTGSACTGGGTTSQSCTTPDLGADGAKNVYIACTDSTNADTADTNENLTYTLDTVSSFIKYHFENNANVLNSGTGSTAYDSTFTGNAAYSATARVGSYGAAFDRTADYINLGWGNGINPRNQSFSAMFWVQESVACPSGTDNHVFGAGDAGAGTRWYVRCRANTWRYRVGGLTEVNTAVAVTTNTWYHIAIVDNADTDTAKLYINGVEKGSVSMTADFSLIGNLFLGNMNDNSGTFAEGSNGIFDEFELYSRAITAQEVLDAYNAPSIPNVPSALSATAYDGRVKLSWTAPTATDQAVTDYKIEYKEHTAGGYSTFTHDASTTTNIFVTGLTNTTNYDFRVSAINAAGTGSPTDAANTTPYAMMTYNGNTPSNAATINTNSLTVSAGSTVTNADTFSYTLYQNGTPVQTASSGERIGDYNTSNLTQITNTQNLSLADNTSSITYVPTSNSLFVIHNNTATIDETSLDGTLIRSITCSSCGDTEGLEWISSTSTDGGYNHTFIVSTEVMSRLFRVVIGPSTTSVTSTDTYAIVSESESNSGAEGVAYDSVHNVYYVLKEKTPIKIRKVDITSSSPVVTEICDAATLFSGVAIDAADLDYETSTGYLYVLSQESEKLMTIDISNPDNCSIVRSLDVSSMTQAEGVTWDDSGDYLYVNGEPDELSVYRTNNYSASHTFTGLSDGTYTYAITLTDTLGVATVTTSRTITIDATPPTKSSFTPASASTIIDSTPSIIFSLNENGDCKISLTDQAYSAMTNDCTGDDTQSISCTAPDLGADGAKNVYIACKDTNGTEDTTDTNEALNFTLDTTVPAPSSFNLTSTSTITTATPTITFNLNENGDCYASTTDETFDQMSDNTNCTGDGSQSISCTLANLGSDGSKNVYIACEDTAGNKDNASTNENFIFNLDTTAPTPENLAVTPDDTTAIVAWSTTEESSTQVEYGTTTDYGITTTEADTSTRTTDHSVPLSGLTCNTSYHYRVISKDTPGLSGQSNDSTFTTDTCPAAETVVNSSSSETKKESVSSTPLTIEQGKTDQKTKLSTIIISSSKKLTLTTKLPDINQVKSVVVKIDKKTYRLSPQMLNKNRYQVTLPKFSKPGSYTYTITADYGTVTKSVKGVVSVINKPSALSSSISYTVKTGDSLWKIAQNLLHKGSSFQRIIDANKNIFSGISKFILRPGQTITIPR